MIPSKQPEQDETLIVQFVCEQSDFSIVFEDNGRVAYAYLLEHGTIISDVWLYNRGDTPESPEWNEPSKMPFKNPSEYVSRLAAVPASSKEDVEVKWLFKRDVPIGAKIFVRHSLIGKLIRGEVPGWSVYARLDGPCAKRLNIENEL